MRNTDGKKKTKKLFGSLSKYKQTTIIYIFVYKILNRKYPLAVTKITDDKRIHFGWKRSDDQILEYKKKINVKLIITRHVNKTATRSVVSLNFHNHFKKINQFDFKPRIFSPSANYTLQTLNLGT